MILAALLVIAIACASYFGLRLRQVQRTSRDTLQEPTAWTPELRELWAPLLSMDRPLVVCLQTQGGSDASPAHSLTGLATANGAFLLGQFLADRKQNVFLTGSEALSLPEISMGNVVFSAQPLKIASFRRWRSISSSWSSRREFGICTPSRANPP